MARISWLTAMSLVWLSWSVIAQTTKAQTTETEAPTQEAVQTSTANSSPATPSLEQLLSTPLSDVPQQIEVSTAARYAQSSNQSVNVTYVVTAADIELFQWQTLAQILQSLPGIYISSDSAFLYVGVRGLGQPGDFNSRLLFMLDGVRINENIYDAGLLGSDAIIDVENIDRVEFAAGPGAAVYGNNAFFGVVNILTKTAQQLRGGALRMTMQNNGSNRYFFNTARRLEQGAEWWFSASHQQHPELPLAFEPPAGDAEAYQALNHEHLSRLRVGYRQQGLRLQALWSGQTRYSPSSLLTPAGWQTVAVADQNDNFLLSLAHQHTIAEDLTLSGHLNQSGSRYQRNIPIYHPDFAQTILHNDQLGRWFSGDLLLQYQGLTAHDLLFGLEFQDDVRQQIEVSLAASNELYQGYYGHNQRKSMFVQDQWQLLPQHSLLLGVRYDDSRVSPARWSPRVGWIWQLNDAQNLKLLHGSAYRAANLYEFATNSSFFAPQPEVETVTSTELTFEQQLSRQFSYRLSWYYADIDDLIALEPTEAVFTNSNHMHNYGTELTLDWRLQSGAMFSAAWSWQRGQNALGQRLQNSPQHLVKLQYQQPISWLDAQFSATALGMSQRWVGDSPLAAYVVIDLGLTWQLSTEHLLAIQLQNAGDRMIFDRPIQSNPPALQPGRVFSVTWRWQLW